MGIREKLNENPGITTGITVGIIVIALFYIVDSQFTNFIFGESNRPPTVTSMFYTVDDGQNLFADEASKVAPFDKDGKEAVRAYVYTCGDGQFIGYLEKLAPEAKKRVDKLKAGTPEEQMEAEMIQAEGSLVKKPGTGRWVPRNSAEGDNVMRITCPDGSVENLNIVLPD